MRALRSRTQALVLDSSLGVRFPRILVIVATVAVQGDTSVPYSNPHLRPEVIADSVAPYGERQILTSYHPSFVKVDRGLLIARTRAESFARSRFGPIWAGEPSKI